jgi:hypothetical protein
VNRKLAVNHAEEDAWYNSIIEMFEAGEGLSSEEEGEGDGKDMTEDGKKDSFSNA